MNVARHPLFARSRTLLRLAFLSLVAVLFLFTIAACGGEATPAPEDAPAAAATDVKATAEVTLTTADPGAAEVLSALEPITLGEDEKLRVVATTSIVADVARRVGGEAIEVTTLMPLGVDPHSYSPTPQDLRTLNEAHLILVNGLGLEEALIPMLTELESPVPVVSVNAGLAPLTYGPGTEAEGAASEEEAAATTEEQVSQNLIDPHTWLSVGNVLVWVDNIAAVLAMLDAEHVNDFFTNASAFQGELTVLDEELRAQIETLPDERRKLVSDHLEFNYFAEEYGFEVIGAALPGVSTMSASSAQELAALQDAITEAGVTVIFVSENVDDSVVNQLASDLGLEVVKLYISSLSEADGPAPDYLAMMRANVNTIVTALAE